MGVFHNILSNHPSTIPKKFPIVWLSLDNSNDNFNQNPIVETILTILWMKFLVTTSKEWTSEDLFFLVIMWAWIHCVKLMWFVFA
jgi:hypothetical protein